MSFESLARQQRVSVLGTPSPSLLLSFTSLLHTESIMCDPSIPSHVSWSAAITLDSLRHSQVWDTKKCKWDSALSHLTIDNMYMYVEGLGWFEQLAKPIHPIQSLLNKVLNQRCRGRRYCFVALRALLEPNNVPDPVTKAKAYKKYKSQVKVIQETHSKLKQLLLCSLLGNYEHTPAASRPKTDARNVLYILFNSGYKEHREWFLQLVLNGSSVLIYCLRDYLVHAVRDCPALHARLKNMMQFDKFESIVTSAMVLIREYFAHNIAEPLSALNYTLEHPKDQASWARFVAEIEWILKKTHGSLLEITYRRPPPTLGHLLLSARRCVPLVSSGDPLPVVIVKGGGGKKKKEQREKSLLTFISPEQYSFVVSVMESYTEIVDAIPWMEHAGVPVEICELLVEICKGCVGSSQAMFRRKLQFLACQHPHAYNLLHTIAQIHRDKLRYQTLRPLPKHYLDSQIKACQTRFQMEDTKLVLEEMVHFVFCPVCDTIYSLVRDFHSVYKANYEYGLRDAVCDYDTGLLYCKHDKTNQIGSCQGQPLMRVPLLGQFLKFKQKLILMCGQPGCGMPCVLDVNLAMHNEHGYGCSACTTTYKKHQDLYESLELRHCNPPGVTRKDCLLCDAAITKADQVFLFPFDIWLCKKHAKQKIKEFVRKQDLTKHTRESLSGLMVQFQTKLKQEWQQNKNAAKDKRLLSMHKYRSRMQLRH